MHNKAVLRRMDNRSITIATRRSCRTFYHMSYRLRHAKVGREGGGLNAFAYCHKSDLYLYFWFLTVRNC